jgi:uncharacterized protein with PIN domain
MTSRNQNGDVEMLRVRATLDKLERREWWRWATALVVMLVLTIGLFLVTPSIPTPDRWENVHLDVALRGLLGMVLLFAIFAIYQRLQIARLRRQLAMQMATVATLEALKPLSPEERRGQKERRRWQRLQVDELLKVIATTEDRERQVYGRVRDISENGLGAVIPDTLNLGDPVTLAFALGKSTNFTLMAIVRHRRGFHYGFEYQDVPATMLQSLKDSLANIGSSADMQPLPR